ncbi:NIMA related kinase 1, putative (NEK1) [Plasmodium ovale curtisi]|uniref:non-specific serine/threonine protein kinase n=1 Tax=Plasmodium ovale curtisi TaxID=864141 RepID=A0A1A8W6N2_PLAOA|nr:NIMA related kinase 1, putative (NEK1) [Plasmodium ovale curtisi]
MPSKYDDGENRLNEYEVIKKIGNGRFGEVFLVKHKRTQEFFCWKAISYRGLKEREKSQLVIEVNVMRELKHKNIVRYIDRFLNKANQKLYILMEFCDAGDLSRNIQKCYKMFGKIEEHAIIDITRQLLHALAYCHNLKDGPNGERVLHRDLKPQNIFLSTGIRHIGKITAQANNLNGRPIAKIGDFGLSKNIGIESMAHSCVGTPYYWSPELLLHETKSYDDKSDMWALGCIIYELCSGKTPFHKANNFAQLISELKRGPELPIKGKSKELNILIKNLLNLSAKERPSALQCLGYQIIKNVTPPAINRKDNACTELVSTDSCKNVETKNYDTSQNTLLNKRSNERERSSSCLSRKSVNTISKDTMKHNQDASNHSLAMNGQYTNRGEKLKMYDIEKERLIDKEKMKRELLEREHMERNRIEKENTHRKALEMKLMEKKRMERERQEKERQERERKERELQERERMGRIGREKKERLERERVERVERAERVERVERDRLERERLERERLERERLERERLERERLERERMQRIENERIERIEREKMQQRLEKERIEKTQREKYFHKGLDNDNNRSNSNSNNNKVETMRNGRIQLKSQGSYNNTFSRMKETYDHVNNFKAYMYDNRKSNNYDEKYDKCDVNAYLRNNSGSTIMSSKNVHSYGNSSGTPVSSGTHVSSSTHGHSNVQVHNNYGTPECYGVYNNHSTISPYSSNSVDSAKYKNESITYQKNTSKNAKDVYNENIDSSYRSPPYDRNYYEHKENANVHDGHSTRNDHNGGSGTCKSSRISNVYFNDSARRSVSAMPHMNNNLSRRKSGLYMCEDEVYNKNVVEENRNYKNLEKDREYLLEKRKLLLEKEKEIYEHMRQNNNYTYSTMQRYDRCENMKSMNKPNELNRRNRSVSICMNEQEKRISYNTKKEHEDEENNYSMKNKNIYTLKNLVHNSGEDTYDRNLYSYR